MGQRLPPPFLNHCVSSLSNNFHYRVGLRLFSFSYSTPCSSNRQPPLSIILSVSFISTHSKVSSFFFFPLSLSTTEHYLFGIQSQGTTGHNVGYCHGDDVRRGLCSGSGRCIYLEEVTGQTRVAPADWLLKFEKKKILEDKCLRSKRRNRKD